MDSIDLEQVANVLGITTLIGAFFAQVPQIIAIIQSRKVDGLSFNGFVIETFSLTIQVLYFVAKKYSVTAYADISLLLIQDYVIIVLIIAYAKERLSFLEYGQVAGYLVAVAAVLFGTITEGMIVNVMQGVILLNIASKVSFVSSILDTKDTSAMQPAGWGVFFYSNLVRIFVGYLVLGDMTIVAQHVFNACANLTVLLLVLKYRNGSKEVAEKKEE